MNDNSKKLEELRRKYQSISFEKYEINDYDSENEKTLEFSFFYEIKGLEDEFGSGTFKTSWKINKLSKVDYDKNLLEKEIFSLGMVELISYYKLCCPEEINIKCGYLDNKQIEWWKKLIINGLGEFFYTNNINFTSDMFKINVKNNAWPNNNEVKSINLDSNKVLAPIGGGKDSSVTIEILKNNFDTYCYIINERGATTNTFEKSGLDKSKLILAERTFDKKIIELNNKGFLNGHTPFSALVAFSGVIAAYINGIKYITLSNESSANESTVLGSTVNHQYSKSFEFECDFRKYQEDLKQNVEYFSLLRPLAEAGIAKLFSKYTEYHPIFRSCNAGSKEDKWCCKCAKCLFVYIILSPFIKENELVRIFGTNLLNDESLKEIFDKLIGIIPEKPFECVGSRDEVNASLQYLVKQYNDNNEPKLIKYYKTLNIPYVNDINNIASSFNNEHNLNDKFMKTLKEAINKC